MMTIAPRSIVEVLLFSIVAGAVLLVVKPGRRAAREITSPELSSEAVPGFPALLGVGHRIGPADAPTQILVFSDFQCPFCKRLDAALNTLQKEQPNVGVVFRHFPLTSIHQYADQAGVAAECAGAQGRFDDMRVQLFTHQSELGTKAWKDFARDAKVPKLSAFDACLREDVSARKVMDRDVRAAESLGVRGTPWVLINGRKLNRPPSLQELRDLVASGGRLGAAGAR